MARKGQIAAVQDMQGKFLGDAKLVKATSAPSADGELQWWDVQMIVNGKLSKEITKNVVINRDSAISQEEYFSWKSQSSLMQ